MLSRGNVSELQRQAKYVQKGDASRKYASVAFDEVLKHCQQYISKTASNFYRRLDDAAKKREMTERYIIDYVETQKPEVEGYDDLISLKGALIDEITQYGPITEVMEDPEIDEIRANGPRQIFIERYGRTEMLDKQFNDREHMERIISKLIGVSKMRLTPRMPMVNARTIEGYRVNATHGDISPYDSPAFVIRKFKKSAMSPLKMIEDKSFSTNMFRMLSMMPKADLSWITVGPTGSGKTTLNEVLIRQIDPLCRIITIENPAEMRLLRHKDDDAGGRVINDVLQYESVSEDDDSSPATMENLLINAMRQSPHWIGPGELRAPGEFATALRAAQTGHYFFTTLHAEGDKEAIFRFLTAYLMVSDEPAELALRNICSAVKFVVFQEKLADGTRKVTSISEVMGSEGLSPIVNQIYRYECMDVEEDEGTGKVLRIIGRHKRVGVISDEICQRMLKSGIRKSRFEFLTVPPSPDEEEVYDTSGININV
ncbi:pilus assembly protein CpaF [Anaerobacterium chartisolvens]|uniref:Pilus assembly protein CpaF n=1 Tax=Anaerobacterium chartisolvens TaxID=1297424 RepID=A0A369BEZ4_9FIRM|nr:ATPase, T2SS/T4P/T4SS family [Anaerobacterium chartisolvens]RCX18254.1 pilus assembly protein CpaF [Anaerobacterium chartisolvens]